MKADILLLPGDGIGPEVVAQAWRVVEKIATLSGHTFNAREGLIGGVAIDSVGESLPPGTLRMCSEVGAVMLGAVGGPAWESGQPEQGLLALRRELGVYANLRPIRVMPGLLHCSPLKRERVEDVDLLFVRELTGGIYYGEPRFISERDGERYAVDTLEYSESEIKRVLSLACQLAMGRRRKVTSVDKANVLDSSRLWRAVAHATGEVWPEVIIEHQLVDSCAMRLIAHAQDFDVIVTENMFGDILTDEAAVIVGSLGLLPSASLGNQDIHLYEPIHGSAPDIVGKNLANPVGAILSAAMMLRLSFDLDAEARAIETAVAAALAETGGTADMGGRLSTEELTSEIVSSLGSGSSIKAGGDNDVSSNQNPMVQRQEGGMGPG